MDRATIRDIFLANGFAIKDGHDDLKDYVYEAAEALLAEATRQIDALLAHCPDGECGTCGTIICPHGDQFHFHHDGCPSCAEAEGA
jgi:hypothetical protein